MSAAPSDTDDEPRTFLLDVPFAMRAAASAAGATWDTELKAHVYRAPELPRALRPFGAQPYSLEFARELEINDEDPPEREPLGGLEPRPHQRDAIKAILLAARANRCGFLLADDVGLGKTLSALKGALHLPGVESILIVCPLGVMSHWRQTILHLGDHGKRIVVINYDRLARLFEAPPAPARKSGKRKAKRKPSKRTLNKRLAAKGELTMAFDCVIFDESHKLRNVTTQRSRLAAKLQQAATFTIWASATAGEDPLKLAYLAPLLAQATRSNVKDLAEYESWCEEQGIGVTRGAYGQWSWDRESPTAAQDLECVRQWLFEGMVPVGIRRRPEDIAGWPEVQRVPMPVELDAESQELYDEEWRAFRKAMQLGGRTPKDRANALVARLRFRQKASLLRVPGTVALAEDLLENGRQVAISVEFRETQEAIRAGMEKAGYTCTVINGDQSPGERERERLRFQRGQAPVIVYTVTEAISLHAGDTLAGGNPVTRANILSDCRYSAIACAQIEGRCHRDGQHATVYYMFAEDTIEEEIVQTVVARLRTMKTMIGDDTETLAEIEALLSRGRSIDELDVAEGSDEVAAVIDPVEMEILDELRSERSLPDGEPSPARTRRTGREGQLDLGL